MVFASEDAKEGPEGVRREAQGRTGRTADGRRSAQPVHHRRRASDLAPRGRAVARAARAVGTRWCAPRPTTPARAATCSARSSRCRSCTASRGSTTTRPAGCATRLGIDPKHRCYSGIGGTTPQVLVDDAADADRRAATSTSRVVVRRRGARHGAAAEEGGERPQWSFKPERQAPFPFEAPFHPAEVAHEVFQAYTTFALWDVARRAHLGVAPDEYRALDGRAVRADDRDRGPQPVRVVPGRARRATSWSRRRPTTGWSRTRTRST